MRDRRWRRTTAAAALAAGLLACTLPWTAGGRNTAATMVVETVSALQTLMGGSNTPVPSTMAPAATVAPPLPLISTPVPLVTQTPPTPVVQVTSLCWTGPGTAYPVVSGIKAGTTVTVLGVGSQAGWLVIENPTYRDRCWIESNAMKTSPFIGMFLVLMAQACSVAPPPVQMQAAPALVSDTAQATLSPTVGPTSTPTSTTTPAFPSIEAYIASIDVTDGCASPTVENWEELKDLARWWPSGWIQVTTLHRDDLRPRLLCRGLLFIPSREGGNGLIYYVPKAAGVAVVEEVYISKGFAQPLALLEYVDANMSFEMCRGKRTEAWLSEQWALSRLSMPEDGKLIASRLSTIGGPWECTFMILLPDEAGGLGKVIYTPEGGPMIIADVYIAPDQAEGAWLNPIELVPSPAPVWSERVQ